jgi:hypothetical protein
MEQRLRKPLIPRLPWTTGLRLEQLLGSEVGVSILCESAIDALSCHALHPEARCLSTAGARPEPAWLADLLAQDGTLYCGFDLDATGEAMAQVMIARHPAIQRLRPSRKDWNDVLRAGG